MPLGTFRTFIWGSLPARWYRQGSPQALHAAAACRSRVE